MRKVGLHFAIMLVFLISSITTASSYIDQQPGDVNAFYSDQEIDKIPTYGQISGSVYGSSGWSTFPLPFALVQAGGRSTYTNLFGNYVIDDLPLNVQLQVIASKPGWVSQMISTTLTEGNPMQSVHFVLNEDDSGGGVQYIDMDSIEGVSSDKRTKP